MGEPPLVPGLGDPIGDSEREGTVSSCKTGSLARDFAAIISKLFLCFNVSKYAVLAVDALDAAMFALL